MSAAASIRSEVQLRDGVPEDVAFVRSSWLRSYRDRVEVSGPVYWHFQGFLVDRLLQRAHTTVACNPEDAAQIFAYAVHETRGPILLLHYLLVKAPFRKLGLASLLMESIGAKGCHYTHRTPAFLPLARRFGAHFNPYLAGDT
jgi:GNAT superfamily N-acetyltransferase